MPICITSMLRLLPTSPSKACRISVHHKHFKIGLLIQCFLLCFSVFLFGLVPDIKDSLEIQAWEFHCISIGGFTPFCCIMNIFSRNSFHILLCSITVSSSLFLFFPEIIKLCLFEVSFKEFKYRKYAERTCISRRWS